MKKFCVIVIICLASLQMAYAEAPIITGFIPGQIWYSQEPLVEGETVKIYTGIWNNDTKPLSVRVEFYDRKVILGARDVTVPASSLRDVSITWKVTAGDHVVSAKILSSNITTGTKKENIVLQRNITEEDKVFVPVVIKNVDGTPASGADVVRSQVEKATSTLNLVIPSSIDSFRGTTYVTIDTLKKETQTEIAGYEDANGQTGTKPLDATEKPIAKIKLLLLSVAGFIFGYPVVFYGIFIILGFLIIRFVYRKIRNK